MCKIVDGETYGYELKIWELAKKEAIQAILTKARQGSTIFYSDLTRQIRGIIFAPHDSAFHHLLGEISKEEDSAGRGMLSVLVVHKSDRMPGPGFFDLAKDLGRDITDKECLWSNETKFVLSHCQNHPLAAI